MYASPPDTGVVWEANIEIVFPVWQKALRSRKRIALSENVLPCDQRITNYKDSTK